MEGWWYEGDSTSWFDVLDHGCVLYVARLELSRCSTGNGCIVHEAFPRARANRPYAAYRVAVGLSMYFPLQISCRPVLHYYGLQLQCL